MKAASALGTLLTISASVLACATEVAGTNGDAGTSGVTLNPACALLAPCCEKWPADVKRSCTGPVEGNGDGCKALLSNNAVVATYCPELSIESCSEDLKKVLPEQCGAGGGGTAGLGTFTASNIGKVQAPDGLTDIAFANDYAVCALDGATGASSCLTGASKFVAKQIGDYDVLFAKSVTIPEKAMVNVVGTRPVVIVATETIELQGGSISAGYRKYANLDSKGPRPGAQATGAGVGGNYYGGGAFCGAGGLGFDGAGTAGKAYGNATLDPLTGGSNGADTSGGAGAGALQLVAGSKLVINGFVDANGQDGKSGGGGSGGALLLEAPTIEGQGFISALGGKGADNSNSGSGGGGGGGETTAPGKNATYAYAGGGGGAGRIRLNARTMAFTGTLAPNEKTTCASKGTLADP